MSIISVRAGQSIPAQLESAPEKFRRSLGVLLTSAFLAGASTASSADFPYVLGDIPLSPEEYRSYLRADPPAALEQIEQDLPKDDDARRGLDHRLVQLLAVPAKSGLPALILSGQDGLTTHLVADVGEGMIEALGATRPDRS
ncbi:hypothetical protein [Thiocapsa rosea]|uniref:Uncharacterized protein n=1 Tax=Thiocapsa rosea TaxID=69360 RepID=A0A495V9K1_9GAMM|nr:hypothetical protein [Thiocapsa rosea]RKT44468.1 hypothetical protein BDD21_1852 [Thiocapsa rosea]